MLIIINKDDRKGTAMIVLQNAGKSITKHVRRLRGSIFRDCKGIPFNLSLAK